MTQWLPLESNPSVMSAYLRRLGLPAGYAFHDVYGLDDDLLAMVPQPALAVLLLFPVTPEYEARRLEQEAQLKADNVPEAPPGVWFVKQTVGNACGTIGLLHAAGNNASIAYEPGSFLSRFFAATAPLDANARAAALEKEPELAAAHASAAEAGDTAAPAAEEESDLHFICLVHAAGQLYELDGRKSRPVSHGPCTPDALLAASARVAREFMELAQGKLQFNLIALGPAVEDD